MSTRRIGLRYSPLPIIARLEDRFGWPHKWIRDLWRSLFCHRCYYDFVFEIVQGDSQRYSSMQEILPHTDGIPAPSTWHITSTLQQDQFAPYLPPRCSKCAVHYAHDQRSKNPSKCKRFRRNSRRTLNKHRIATENSS